MLTDLPFLVYVAVAVVVIAVVVFVALPLVRRQAVHQAAEDAAVDRWRAGGAGD